MPLPTKTINFKIGAGISENSDEFQQDPNNMLTVSNGEFQHDGIIEKRDGDTSIGQIGGASGKTVNQIFDYQGAPTLLGVAGLFDYKTQDNLFRKVNPMGPYPAAVKVLPFGGQYGQMDYWDMCTVNGYTCYVWNTVNGLPSYVNAAVAEVGVFYMVTVEATGHVVIPPTRVEVSGTINSLGVPRCCVVGTSMVIIFGNLATAASTLKAFAIDTTTTPPSVGVTAALPGIPAASIGYWDCAAQTSNPNLFVCYAPTAGNAAATKYSITGTVIALVAGPLLLPLPGVSHGLGATYKVSNDTFFVGIRRSTDGAIVTYSIPSNLIGPTAGSTVIPAYGGAAGVSRITFAEQSSTEMFMFYDSVAGGAKTIVNFATEMLSYNGTVKNTLNYEVLYNYSLATKAFQTTVVGATAQAQVGVRYGFRWNSFDPGDGSGGRNYFTLSNLALVMSPTVRQVYDPGTTSVVSVTAWRPTTRLLPQAHFPYLDPLYAQSHLPFVVKTKSTTQQPEVMSTVLSSVIRRQVSVKPDGGSGGLAVFVPDRVEGNRIDLDMNGFPCRTADVAGKLKVVSGGYIATYDGNQAVETCPHIIPDAPTCIATMGGAAHPDGSFFYKIVYYWEDAQGNTHRSAPSIAGFCHPGGVWDHITVSFPRPPPTAHALMDGSRIGAILYRTDASGSLFYEITRGAPSIDATDFTVAFFTDSDASVTPSQSGAGALYTDAGELESDPPPAMVDLCASPTRLCGISGEVEGEVWFSKLFAPGFPPEWNSLLTAHLPGDGGKTLAVAPMDGKFIFFKEGAIFLIAGDGPNNAGLGEFGDPQPITFETGIIEAQSLVRHPDGLAFRGKRGFYFLTRDLQLKYIGTPVETSLDTNVIVSAVNVPKKSQIRWQLSNSTAIVWSTLFNQWSTFSSYQAIAACVSNDLYHKLWTDATVTKETPGVYVGTGTEASYLVLIRTPWYKLGGYGQFSKSEELQDYQRVRRMYALGQYYSSGALRVTHYYNYNGIGQDVKNWTKAELLALPRFQVGTHIPRQKSEAISFKFEEIVDGTAGKAFSISDLTLQVGVKPTPFKKLPDGAKK